MMFPTTVPMITVVSGSVHNENFPLASVWVTAAGQSSAGPGSKSTHAPAAGCVPALVAIMTTPEIVRNPGGEGRGAPVSAVYDTNCTATGPIVAIGAAQGC